MLILAFIHCFLYFGFGLGSFPLGPQGPAGTSLKFDLLSNTQPGISCEWISGYRNVPSFYKSLWGFCSASTAKPTTCEYWPSRHPLIAGLEWNVLEDEGKVDLTWWISWFDQISQSWRKEKTTKSLIEEADNDYLVFYSSFVTEGFSLIIDLTEGGPMPGTNEVLVDGQPQYMHVSSVKVYWI